VCMHSKGPPASMKRILLLTSASLLLACGAADQNLDSLEHEIQGLKRRVAALEEDNRKLKQQVEVDRLIVRKELIVSDTGRPWEKGFESHQLPRGIYARSLWDGPGGLWVRSRLIKGEIDDPFDDRFHALEKDGSLRRAPGHISWNVWIDGAWRQMAIIQGEGLELSEIPIEEWTGGSHPGRLRFQTYRPQHDEPLTDALIGQGMMSLGGGGYGGGGLPHPSEVLQRGPSALGRRDTASANSNPRSPNGGEGRWFGRASIRHHCCWCPGSSFGGVTRDEGERSGEVAMGQYPRR